MHSILFLRAAIKNFLKFFIRKQYENLPGLAKKPFRQAGYFTKPGTL